MRVRVWVRVLGGGLRIGVRVRVWINFRVRVRGC